MTTRYIGITKYLVKQQHDIGRFESDVVLEVMKTTSACPVQGCSISLNLPRNYFLRYT